MPRHSSSQGSAAALDSLDLLDGPDGAPEARGQLVAVEELALGRLDGGERRGRSAADATLGGAGPCAAQGAVLLGAVAVLGEGAGAAGEVGGEGVGGTGWVGLGGVVNGGWRGLSAFV